MDILLTILTLILVTGIGSVIGGITVLMYHDPIVDILVGKARSSFRTELLIDAVNANKNGMFICTNHGRFVFVNVALCKLLGYTKDELLEKTFLDITPPEFVDQDKFFLEKSVNGKLDTFEIRKSYVSKGGKFVPVILQVSALRNSKGDVTYFIVNMQKDVNTERNMVVNNRYFESAFNYSNVGMAVMSRTGEFLQVNKTLSDLLGYTIPELLRKTFQEITHPDDMQEDLTYVQRMLDNQIDTYTMRKHYIRKDKSLLHAILSVSGVYDVDGELTTFISQIQPITGDVNV